jgi:metal-responsive CopG/Arc/MetJ family transcriptional regulator
MNNKKLGTISILIKDRQSNADGVQKILTEAGHTILARLGVNVEPACIEHCTGLICVAAQGTDKEISDLCEKLNALNGIAAKASILTE